LRRDLIEYSLIGLVVLTCLGWLGCTGRADGRPGSNSEWQDPPSRGGSGGEGGSEGAGGIGGSDGEPCGSSGPLPIPTAVESAPTWLDSAGAWQLIPAAPDVFGPSCSILEADTAKIHVPRLDWVDCDAGCGRGCTRASLAQDLRSNLLSHVADVVVSTSIAENASAGFVSLVHSGHDDKTRLRLIRVVSLESGETVAAVLASSVRTSNEDSCFPVTGQSALWTKVWGQGSFEFLVSGGLDVISKRFTWQLPLREGYQSEWNCPPVFVEDGAKTFFLCPGAIAAATTPGSSDLHFLSTPGPEYVPVTGASDGSSAFWVEARNSNLGSRIQGWNPEGGRIVTVIENIPGDSCGFAANVSHFVGLMYSGELDRGCFGKQDGLRFWKVDRADSELLVRTGPTLPGDQAEIKSMAIWGDFVAGIMLLPPGRAPSERAYVVLARMSDWSVRRLNSPIGAAIGGMALTSTHLYLSTIPDDAHYRSSAGDFYRFDLSKFSDIGVPIE